MAADIHMLGLHYNCGFQPAMNVLHFISTVDSSTDPDQDSAELVDAFIATIQPALLACLPENVQLIGYKARRINNTGGPTYSAPIAGGTGTRPGLFSAGAIGPCINWGYFTGIRWRTGRTFLPGVSDDDLTNNLFATSLYVATTSFIQLMLTSPIFVTSHAGNWSFGIYAPAAGIFTTAETGGVSGKPGIQNGRMKPTF